MQPTVLPVLGVRIASVTYAEAEEIILRQARAEKNNAYVCAANVHTVALARHEPLYRQALNGALLAVPDGTPLVWAHWLLGGRKLKERVYGPTLMLRLCEGAAREGLPIYLYGGTPEVIERLSKNLAARYPALKLAGACAPPFGVRAGDDPALLREIEAINASGCRLVFVGLGAPKQEFFMSQNVSRINAVQVGVGAAFDFHSGRVLQAPRWMQRVGLEWFFRLCREPSRLWRRYLLGNPYFVARLFLQRLGLDGPSRKLARELSNSRSADAD
jgi:N-acetylglucosaminyldiphosphoundecaprenol N-acetyl-beta-D-mannosaminyltransferase